MTKRDDVFEVGTDSTANNCGSSKISASFFLSMDLLVNSPISPADQSVFRFNQQSSHRDARSALFSAYDAHASSSLSSTTTRTQQRYPSPGNNDNRNNPYGYYPSLSSSSSGANGSNGNVTFGAYPGATQSSTSSSLLSAGWNQQQQQQKQQKKPRPYNDAVLSELESQNEDQIEGMSAKVKMLKDVSITSSHPCNIPFTPFLFPFFSLSKTNHNLKFN